MRLGALHILLAGASLVTYAAASPIRVVVVSSHEEVSTNVRFVGGQPLVETTAFTPTTIPQPGQSAGRHVGCGLRNKAVAMSNKFREMLGLPLIAPSQHLEHNEDPMEPPPFIGTPMELKPVGFGDMGPRPDGAGIVHILPMPHHGMGHHRPHFHHRSFLHRVHRALMVLGPWEGRAVAFVLGCGIGVLLRMFWVMTILVFRTFRGSRSSDESDVHEVLVFEADAEDILVPPPQYTDEKVALVTAEEERAGARV